MYPIDKYLDEKDAMELSGYLIENKDLRELITCLIDNIKSQHEDVSYKIGFKKGYESGYEEGSITKHPRLF